MWKQHNCSAYTARLRDSPWVQTLLSKTRPPRRFDVLSAPVPESSVQSSGFHRNKIPQPKKRPRVIKLMAQSKYAAKTRPRGEATPAESSLSSSGAVMPSFIGQKRTEPGGGASSSSGAVMRSVTGQEHTEPGGGASSSRSAAVSSVQCGIPWPCTECMRMPWRCTCRQAEDRTPEQMEQDFELICKQAGVWEGAEALQGEADQKVGQLEPPEEHHPKDMWACNKCSTHNLKHNLLCSVVGCGARRQLTQTWRQEDWICKECQNHNSRRFWCNWSACPSNNWRCTCGNINRANRKFCNLRVCRLPRPFNYD